MAAAEVGDDVYGEDPTVNRLEAMAAARLGKEAALFVSSGTQSNLVALLTHCRRGEEYIAGQTAHTYRCEAGGAAVLGGIQPQPLDFEPDGTLDLGKVAAAVKPDDVHFARTRLLCLENTLAGRFSPPLPGRRREIRPGARIAPPPGRGPHLQRRRRARFHAREIVRPFDSVSVCLSRAGRPVGSVLCGSREFIREARRWRKMLGGGCARRGPGRRRNRGARGDDRTAPGRPPQRRAPGRRARPHSRHRRQRGRRGPTWFFSWTRPSWADGAFMAARGILVGDHPGPIRAVTHYGIDAADIDAVLEAAREAAGSQPGSPQ